MKNDELHTVNLFEWTGYDGVKFTRSEEELREVFLNEDKSMRYLHNNGFCIDSFDPRDIDLVDGSKNLIRFNKFSKFENVADKDSVINRDIFVNACLNIGLYTHALSSLDENYLKNNYDSFAQYLPESDVPYYRGIIQRGAGVYLCDYAVERRNRDFIALQKELSEEDQNSPVEEIAPVNEDELTNKVVNDQLYKDLMAKKKIKGVSDFAFIHILLLPTIAITFGIIACLISFLLNILG